MLYTKARTVTLALLASTSVAFAGILSGPKPGASGSVTFAVQSVNPPGGPTFNASGDLVNIAGLPGAKQGWGSLGEPVPFDKNINNIPFPVQESQGATSGFGGGEATLTGEVINGGGAAGILWFNPTKVTDISDDGNASVNFSRGVASFHYKGKEPGIPYAGMAISATLHGKNAFEAVTLFGTFTFFNSAGTRVGSVSDGVAIVSDGSGPRNDFITGIPSEPGGRFFDSDPGALESNSFKAYAVDILPEHAIPDGGSVSIDGTLSFVANAATIEIGNIPSNIPLGNLGPSTPVPEMSNLGLVAVGALSGLIVLWRRRKSIEPLYAR